MSEIMHTLHVELGERAYPIYIGRDLLTDGSLLGSHIAGSQVVLISNTTIAPLYLARVRDALGERALVTEVILDDGEQYKTLASLERIFDAVLADNHSRNTTMIALGGGVVGDITGFAAACYQRGVHFVQLPTTLLAQVDSSVGGKTAVNHPLGKNMIGAFHQPIAVLIDIDSLRTLPQRELSAGLAEVLKYGLIRDVEFYAWLREHMGALMAGDRALLAQAIERSCRNKAEVVAADEREAGERALLNLGHTFGHAIETGQGYGKWLHGEAVATGMLLAAELSCRRGWIDRLDVDQLRDLLVAMQLPIHAHHGIATDEFLATMARDKKVIDGRLRLVLLRDIGQACVVDDVRESELIEVLTSS